MRQLLKKLVVPAAIVTCLAMAAQPSHAGTVQAVYDGIAGSYGSGINVSGGLTAQVSYTEPVLSYGPGSGGFNYTNAWTVNFKYHAIWTPGPGEGQAQMPSSIYLSFTTSGYTTESALVSDTGIPGSGCSSSVYNAISNNAGLPVAPANASVSQIGSQGYAMNSQSFGNPVDAGQSGFNQSVPLYWDSAHNQGVSGYTYMTSILMVQANGGGDGHASGSASGSAHWKSTYVGWSH